MLCLAATGLESGTKLSGADFERLSGVQSSCTSRTNEGALNPRAVTSSPDNNNETHETPNYSNVWPQDMYREICLAHLGRLRAQHLPSPQSGPCHAGSLASARSEA